MLIGARWVHKLKERPEEDRPLYDLYGVHEAEEVAAARPASWRVVWLRTGRLNWLVGSGAINSEPRSDYGNHSAGAIER